MSKPKIRLGVGVITEKDFGKRFMTREGKIVTVEGFGTSAVWDIHASNGERYTKRGNFWSDGSKQISGYDLIARVVD